MGGGGSNLYGGTQGGGFNQAQQNYINTQGKLPSQFGGTPLNQSQQNFFSQQGYLPQGFQGGDKVGQQYYQQPNQQQNFFSGAMPYQGGGYNDFGSMIQQLLGGGGYGGYGGYGGGFGFQQQPMQQQPVVGNAAWMKFHPDYQTPGGMPQKLA